MPNFLRAAPVIRTAALTLALVLLLGWLGPALDDASAGVTKRRLWSICSANQHSATALNGLHSACAALNSPWIEVSPGVVQCLTCHGKPSRAAGPRLSEAS